MSYYYYFIEVSVACEFLNETARRWNSSIYKILVNLFFVLFLPIFQQRFCNLHICCSSKWFVTSERGTKVRFREEENKSRVRQAMEIRKTVFMHFNEIHNSYLFNKWCGRLLHKWVVYGMGHYFLGSCRFWGDGRLVQGLN